jgi:hypothetical protein
MPRWFRVQTVSQIERFLQSNCARPTAVVHKNISTNSASRSLRSENGIQEHRVKVFEELTTGEYIAEFETLAALYASGYRPETSFRQLWGYAHPQQISAMKKNS